MKKGLCMLIGGILVAGAVASVFLVDWKKAPPPEPELVRPIASIVLAEPESVRSREFPGKTSAADSVDLSFEVSGTIQEALVDKGDRVSGGQVLAQLDERTFRNSLNAAKAKLTQAEADFERTQKLFATGNASRAQLDASQAAFTVAKSDVENAAKALEDTTLKAPYDGVIADSYIDKFQNISTGQPVFRLQSADSRIRIEINVAESEFGRARLEEIKDDLTAVALFEFLPGREFPLEIASWESIADPVTQTFRVEFLMEAPEDANILPGMTATVRGSMQIEVEPGEVLVPFSAIVADGTGQAFAWKLVPAPGESHLLARRVNVEAELSDTDWIVTKGLQTGDRIATAGMRVLVEGQKVRPLDPTPAGSR